MFIPLLGKRKRLRHDGSASGADGFPDALLGGAPGRLVEDQAALAGVPDQADERAQHDADEDADADTDANEREPRQPASRIGRVAVSLLQVHAQIARQELARDQGRLLRGGM